MKLVYLFLFVNLGNSIYGDNFPQGQFPFPQNFPTSRSIVSTESSIYIPKEFYSPAPAMLSSNIHNNLPFQLSSLPTPSAMPPLHPNTHSPAVNFPARRDNYNKSSIPFVNHNQSNTQKQDAERRQFSFMPQTFNHKQPIDRMDTKISAHVVAPIENINTPSVNLSPISRGVIISSEKNKNPDLDQKASFQNMHYAQAPHSFVPLTTEPAIPILRLSNEMDLDGSFSYEALGADQTHYVQHSRMENIGTDKEGPIVEGSYSYVGDDGQTYTVHYIADSNGYRATGDHLPVAPPIPEIIQRSIHYNLAEEARRPTTMSLFNDEESESLSDRSKYYTSALNLFTGRTPEAFSMGLSQGTNMQNNLIPMASSKESVQTNLKIPEDKIKRNSNYMSLEPQITFLATQGTHSPANALQKPSMPQLINYKSGIEELEQNNKGLWRWQYGVNSKGEHENPSKNSISRSSSDDDDIIINFSDMTPDQYTDMVRNRLSESIHTNINSNTDSQQHGNKFQDESIINHNFDLKIKNGNNYFQTKFQNIDNATDTKSVFTTENSVTFTSSENPYDHTEIDHRADDKVQKDEFPQEEYMYSSAASIENIQRQGNENDVLKTKTSTSADWNNIYPREYTNSNFNYLDTSVKFSSGWSNHNLSNKMISYGEITDPSASTSIPLDSKYITGHEQEITPVLDNKKQKINFPENDEHQDSTTIADIKEVVRQNIFLKNLLTPNVRISNNESTIINPQYDSNVKKSSNLQTPTNTESKFYEEMKSIQRRPMDMSDVLNYIVHKNGFESNRLRKNNPPIINKQDGYSLDSLSQNRESNYDTIRNKNEDNDDLRLRYNTFRQDQQPELRGIIKNYKVLQRNNVRNSNSELDGRSQSLAGPQGKNVHAFKFPPLGRAGPSMKSYFPPNYL